MQIRILLSLLLLIVTMHSKICYTKTQNDARGELTIPKKVQILHHYQENDTSKLIPDTDFELAGGGA